MEIVWNFYTIHYEERAALEEILSPATSTDRAVAILGGSLVERRLALAIDSEINHLKAIDDEMFKGVGPLASFAAKVHLGYMLGLYGERAWRELRTIKDIRNRFAHSLDMSSFESQKITAWCGNLTLAEMCFGEDQNNDLSKQRRTPFRWRAGLLDRMQDPRFRFLTSVSFYSQSLLHYIELLQDDIAPGMRAASPRTR